MDAEGIASAHGHLSPFVEHIFDLARVRATRPNGRVTPVAPGAYIITAIRGGVVEFRAEVESDFACGDDVKAPAVLPPTLRATPGEFFETDRRPRFSTTYSKGC